MAAGFRAAGIEFDLAFDRDPDACASYAANLGHTPIRIDVHDLLRLARLGWRPGPVDLLVADPPCAPWSRAGKRHGLDDARDMLAETVELVALLRPRAYLIGNIPGLDDAPHLRIVQRTIGALAREGYCVRDYASLDAADYGVPQHRARPFWYGHKIGTPCIQWPEPTHGPQGASLLLPGVAPLRPWVTCKEALGDLLLAATEASRAARLVEADPEASEEQRAAAQRAEQTAWNELGRPVRLRHEGKRVVPRHPPSEMDAPARTVTASDGGGSKRTLIEGGATAWPWLRPATTVHCDPRLAPPGHHAQSFLSAATEARAKRPPSNKGTQSSRIGDPEQPARTIDARVARAGSGDNGTLAWPWDRPATTIFGGLDRLSPPERSGSHGEPQSANAIILSERAAMVLQGFPEGWQICGATKASRWSQIGQAVCPAVAAALGRAVKKAAGL